MDNDLIPVIIPSYQPDEKLSVLVQRLADADVSPVVVVDDGSVGDEYQQIFSKIEERRDSGLIVLHHAVNMGKGRALKTAFNFCLNEYPDMIGCVTIDSDGQHTVGDMEACMAKLREDPNALILGVRDFSKDNDNIPARSSFGNRCTSNVMRLLTGISASDTQTGLRAIPASFMKVLLTEKGERFEFETNMLLDTKENGISIIEVPIHTIYIEGNTSSHFHPILESIRIYAIFFKFIISSGSSSLIDLILFWGFSAIMLHSGFPEKWYIMAATVMARVISSAYNFAMNYKVVFRSDKKKKDAVIRYFILAAFIMVASGILVTFFTTMTGANRVIVKMIVDCLLFLLSFFIQREFVY